MLTNRKPREAISLSDEQEKDPNHALKFYFTNLLGFSLLALAPIIASYIMEGKIMSYTAVFNQPFLKDFVLFFEEYWFLILAFFVLLFISVWTVTVATRIKTKNMGEMEKIRYENQKNDRWLFISLAFAIFLYII